MSRQNTFSLRIVYGLAVLISGTMALSAQDSITPGEPVIVTLDGGGPVELSYSGATIKTVTITARSLEAPNVIDVTLQVIDPYGRPVPGGFADDHDTDRADLDEHDAVIENLELFRGSYRLRVDSFNGVSKGRVEVIVEATDPFEAVVSRDEAGWTITGTLPANRSYTYAFEAVADEVFTLTARDASGALDPVITLRGPDREIAARNDDHAPGVEALVAGLDTFDAQIARFSVPAEGVYRVEVADFLGRGGAFELTIRRESGREQSAIQP